MYRFQNTQAILLSFLMLLTAGCAYLQPYSQPTQSARLAVEYPQADEISVRSTDPGCQSKVVATGLGQPHHAVEPDIYRDHDAGRVEVMRGGRYALVTANATLQQRELLEQIIHISIPASMNSTVEDGLRYILQHTGYRLCSPQGEPQRLLYSRPLPAAHFRLGPMTLREALQVLAGRAFELQADPITRTICYQVRDQRLVSEERVVVPVP